MIEVIDNFLSPSYFKLLQEMVCSENFPWYYRGDITKKSETENLSIDSFGFDYGLIHKDNGQIRDCYEGHISYPAVLKIKDTVECDFIMKARLDLTLYNPNNFRHAPHIDLNYPEFISAILYMNNSDGETVIFDEQAFCTVDVDQDKEYSIKKSVEPKENRLLVFDGHYIHTGHSPSKHKTRVLLNSVYGKKINYE